MRLLFVALVITGCCYSPIPMPELPAAPAPIAADTDMIPTIETPSVAVVHANGRIDVLDVEAARFAHFSGSDALAASMGTGAWISPLGWSASRSAFVLLRSSLTGGGDAIVTLGADGTSETLLADSHVPARPLASAWIESTATIACLVQDESGVSLLRRALGADASETQAWADGGDIDGPFAIAADGSRVVFADACEAGLTGTCLFTSSLDGSDRALVGHVANRVCSLALSGDGRHAILAQSLGPDPACARITTFDLETRVLRGAYDMAATEYVSVHGVTSMALSPDGARFAVLSDEGYGCVSGGGFTSCQLRLSARRFDLTRTWTPDMPALDDGTLVWIH